MLPNNPDNLILHFSKPIGNILAVEIANIELNSPKGVFGIGFSMLFVFDENGLIDKVFRRSTVYN
ncbi:MAG: hypothetical protein CMO01_10380 [Thalassobius sp.]|nr:hypothetical protein [Thalassovita sp.]